MPNGSELTNEQFWIIEQPLIDMDSQLIEFAGDVQCELVINYHHSPNRLLQARMADNVTRTIYITPVIVDIDLARTDQHIPFIVSMLVWRDVEIDRISWHNKLGRYDISQPQIRNDAMQIIRESWIRLIQFTLEELESNGTRVRIPNR